MPNGSEQVALSYLNLEDALQCACNFLSFAIQFHIVYRVPITMSQREIT